MLKLIDMYTTDILDSSGSFVNFCELPRQSYMIAINVTLVIGYTGMKGTHDFYTMLVGGSKREDFFRLNPKTPINSKAIFFREFDGKRVCRKIRSLVDSCERGNWDDTLTELRRHFFWEYEDQ